MNFASPRTRNGILTVPRNLRRGMLWDEARQDADTLSWYRKLIHLRKTIPAITEGHLTQAHTDDETGFSALVIQS